MKAIFKTASGLAVISASVMLAGCEGRSSYRVASVGDQASASMAEASEPAGSNGSADGAAGSGSSDGGGTSGSGGTNGSTGGGGSNAGGANGGSGNGQTRASSRTGKVLITAGNVVLGVAQKQEGLSGKTTALAPASAPVTGKVTRLLTRTGQSLVDIGNGRTVLVGGAGNAIGRVVSLGIANRSLVGVSNGQSLVGVNLLTKTPITGSLVTAGALAGNSLAVVDVTKPNAAGALTGVSPAGVASSVTGAVGTALPSVVSPAGAALPASTALPTGLTGSLTGAVNGGAATSQTGLLPATQATVAGSVKKVVKLGGN